MNEGTFKITVGNYADDLKKVKTSDSPIEITERSRFTFKVVNAADERSRKLRNRRLQGLTSQMQGTSNF